MLHLEQLTDQAHKKPDLLSGGQKQRVAIARAHTQTRSAVAGRTARRAGSEVATTHVD